MHTGGLSLNVHQFTNDTGSPTISQVSLLRSGECLVEAAIIEEDSWFYPRKIDSELNASGRQFVYANAPPRIWDERPHKIPPLKDWGAPPDEDEIFSLADLPPFVNAKSASKRTLPSESSGPQQIPAKKREIDRNPLYQQLPQPHFYPPQLQVSSRPIKIAPYKKSKPIMIPPFKLPLEHFTEWDRCAWLIPICGFLPWVEATSGALLDSSNDTPIPPKSELNEISWTADVVSSFWSFLLSLRQAGNLGRIGISFQPSSTQRTTTFETFPSHVQLETNMTINSPSQWVSAVDHIKIYHEWPRSMQIRNVLDAWSYVSKRGKCRLFVGAKLVLLDDRSKAIMVL